MTNTEKQELRELALQGKSFAEIRRVVGCSDATIRQYIKVFSGKAVNQTPTSVDIGGGDVKQNDSYDTSTSNAVYGTASTTTQSTTDSPETYSTGSNPEGTELDEFTDILLAHIVKAYGRNIGQYVIEYDCSCGATLRVDGHSTNLFAVHAQHIAESILQWHTTLTEQAVLEARIKTAEKAYAKVLNGVNTKGELAHMVKELKSQQTGKEIDI